MAISQEIAPGWEVDWGRGGRAPLGSVISAASLSVLGGYEKWERKSLINYLLIL